MDGNPNVDKRELAKNNAKKGFNVLKDIIKDRKLSTLKDGWISDRLTDAATAIAIGTGLKKGMNGKSFKALSGQEKSRLLRNAVVKRGIPTMAATGFATDIAVPAVRLQRLHKKEFGTGASLKDHAQLAAAKGIPSAAYFGTLYKNRDKMIDGIVNAAKNAPRLVNKNSSMKDRKEAIKALGGAVAATGPVQVMDELTGLAKLSVTPETIIKKKKALMEKKKGATNMKLKEALEIVDEFTKEANSMNSYSEFEKAAAIVEDGYEKIASKKGLLDGFRGILSGKNIEKAQKEINKINERQNIRNIVDSVIKVTKDKAKQQSSLIKDINKLKNASGHANTVKKDALKEINDVKNKMLSQKKATQSAKSGISGKLDNLIHKRTYKKNQATNELIDKAVENINKGRTLPKGDYYVTEKRIFGKNNVENPFGDEIKRYNKAAETLKAANKKVRGVNNVVNEAQTTLKKNGNKFKKLNDRAETAKTIESVMKATDNVKNIGYGLKGAITGNPVGTEAKLNALIAQRNKELAKTMGAYGAIGAGAYGLGKAVNGVSGKNNNSRNGDQTFYPGRR